KQALAADVQRLEARVRRELDIRARIRRDAPRILAVAGGAVLLVGVLVVVRARFAGRRRDTAAPATLDDLVAELRGLRQSIDKKKEAGLLQKGALRALSAAGAAGGTLVARRIVERQETQREGRGPERAG
ncbi:MAG: hypothetical protein JOZ92_06360, partial [Candidatus Dormibacteraeota bacterium]|nr:hypothetical protein [Candidatus Dormibacteraeota bacterium]